jgi:class 3 adenylate cyclase
MSSSWERPTVTALFADLRSSAAPTIDAIVARLGAAIADEHGAVARVSETGLLAIFDGQHVALAARAALAIRAIVDRDGGDGHGTNDLRLGLGLNTGGRAVAIASRLGATAAAGQILIGPGTAALLSSEFDVRDRGTIELAETGPTAVFELVR